MGEVVFIDNLVPRVLRLFGQWLVIRRDSGNFKFYNRRISVVKQWKPLQNSQSKNLNFFEVPRVSPSTHPLTKKPEDSGYEIGSLTVNFPGVMVPTVNETLDFKHSHLNYLSIQNSVKISMA